LLTGTSDYYIAYDRHPEYPNRDAQAIFHKDNPNEPITGWCRSVSVVGLVQGTSEYYARTIENGNERLTQIFHISDPANPVYDISDHKLFAGNALYLDKDTAIFEDDEDYYSWFYNKIYVYDSHSNNLITLNLEPYDIKKRNLLINPDYIQHRVIPMIGYDRKGYIYDISTNNMQTFDSAKEMQEYLDHLVGKNITNDLNY